MSQSSQRLLFGYYTDVSVYMRRLRRGRRAFLAPTSTLELLRTVQDTTTPDVLTKAVNALQYRLSKLPSEEQESIREQLVAALTNRLLTGAQSQLRLEAAGWLRLLLQAGMVGQPQAVFVTMVTSATGFDDERALLSMLTLIFECFWPYRYPYPAYDWQLFPDNLVFTPLAPLLKRDDPGVQEVLIAIFSELPTLDEPEITDHLLPLALSWSNHADPERRRMVTRILARVNSVEAHDALQRLQYDADPIVRASARHAAGFIRNV